ncbi:DUF2971 domain-containing protein [Paraburkholderia fungorum]|uniref:DUF2971 domain-containing protein n=1 Tax=Paraburkholderia fungorum TaxID=134537 RepID=UPI0038B83A7A
MHSLRRYTNIPSLLHILQSRQITLLDPGKWDDSNDSDGMEVYRQQKKLQSVLALCFTETDETYHHWHVFAEGAGGACIVFDKDKLLDAFNASGVSHSSVKYKKLEALKEQVLSLDEMPFTKRWGFRHEKEFRAIYESQTNKLSSYEVNIGLDVITRILLSPWLHKSLHQTTKAVLRSVKGCEKLQVRPSTLTGNLTWKQAFKDAAIQASRNR